MVDALLIQDLYKTYANGVHALQGVSLSVAQGEFIALLGPNGAGKSTTIGIVNSLVRKTSGKVFINGFDLDVQPSEAKACIGVVPQEINFGVFEKPQQILVNQAGYYGVPRKEAIRRSEKYLKLLNLWDKRNDTARNLSGGMKRRLMIARALMHEPQVLILDEPTAGVDVEIRRTMWKVMRELNAQGKTIILTTHYLEEAEQLCDRIAIIHHGKILHDLPKKQLLNLLNMETFLLDLAKPLDQDLPDFPGCVFTRRDQLTVEVVHDKTQSLNALFAFLAQHDISVVSMRNEVNRLEALFLRLIT